MVASCHVSRWCSNLVPTACFSIEDATASHVELTSRRTATEKEVARQAEKGTFKDIAGFLEKLDTMSHYTSDNLRRPGLREAATTTSLNLVWNPIFLWTKTRRWLYARWNPHNESVPSSSSASARTASLTVSIPRFQAQLTPHEKCGSTLAACIPVLQAHRRERYRNKEIHPPPPSPRKRKRRDSVHSANGDLSRSSRKNKNSDRLFSVLQKKDT